MIKLRGHKFSRTSGAADPWAILMVGIATFFCLLITAPLLVVFWLSFFDGSLLDPVIKYSFKNYLTVFSEPFTYKVLLNTAVFSLIALIVSFTFGLPAAWLVERTDLPGKTILLTFMTIGLLIPKLREALAKALETRDDKAVILRGDRSIMLEDAVQLMTIAREAGAERLAIATTPAGK